MAIRSLSLPLSFSPSPLESRPFEDTHNPPPFLLSTNRDSTKFQTNVVFRAVSDSPEKIERNELHYSNQLFKV